jgi:hypothetical protein
VEDLPRPRQVIHSQRCTKRLVPAAQAPEPRGLAVAVEKTRDLIVFLLFSPNVFLVEVLGLSSISLSLRDFAVKLYPPPNE